MTDRLKFGFVYAILVSLSVSVITGSASNESIRGGLSGSLLDSYVDRETDSLMRPTGEPTSCSRARPASGISNYLDLMASKLKEVAMNGIDGRQIRDELARAVNIFDLIDDKDRINVPRKSYDDHHQPKERQMAGLLMLLNEDAAPNPHLVQPSRALSAQAKTEMVEFANSGLSFDQRRQRIGELFERAMTQVRMEEWRKGGRPNGLKQNFVSKIRIGVRFANDLFLGTRFLEDLPLIGEQVRHLKRQGTATYHIIQAVHKVHNLLESSTPDLDLGETGRELAMNHAKRMMSKVGEESLHFLAMQLANKYSKSGFGGPKMRELIGRCAYYLLIHIVKKMFPGCP